MGNNERLQDSIKRAEAAEEQAVVILKSAGELVLGLSVKESDYDLAYLTERLAKCSSYQERLAEMSSRLTLMELPVVRILDAEEADLDVYVAELLESAQYQELKTSDRVRWIKGRTARRRQAHAAWKTTKTALYEVKKAVNLRVDTMRRLDSDLRLHANILQAKIGVGAMPREPERFDETPGWRGNETDITIPPERNGSGEIDLD